MAVGFTIDLGDFLSNSAISYFKQFKRLPPKDLGVSGVTAISGVPSLESLLNAVSASNQNSFLIYAHGQPDGNGLYIRIASRRGAAIGVSATTNVVTSLLTIEKNNKPPTDRQLGFLGIEKAELNRLVGLIQSIRGKKIEAVEFRGCNLGKNPASIKAFKELFSAKTFGAPDLYSFFGDSTVATGQQAMDGHLARRSRMESKGHREWHQSQYQFKNPDGTLLNNVSVGDNLKPMAGYIVADSAKTVDRFVKTYIDKDGSYTGGNLTLHGMWDRGQHKIDISKMRDAPIEKEPELPPVKLIMPAGSEEYKQHVKYG